MIRQKFIGLEHMMNPEKFESMLNELDDSETSQDRRDEITKALDRFPFLTYELPRSRLAYPRLYSYMFQKLYAFMTENNFKRISDDEANKCEHLLTQIANMNVGHNSDYISRHEINTLYNTLKTKQLQQYALPDPDKYPRLVDKIISLYNEFGRPMSLEEELASLKEDLNEANKYVDECRRRMALCDEKIQGLQASMTADHSTSIRDQIVHYEKTKQTLRAQMTVKINNEISRIKSQIKEINSTLDQKIQDVRSRLTMMKRLLFS
jgi:flagellar capping protein FliD